MPAGVDVVVPWAGDRCRHRTAAWRHLAPRYAAAGYRPRLATALGDGWWCKAAAVNPAVRSSSAEVVVILDADVWVGDGLAGAVDAVLKGAPWAIPHRGVFRLTEAATLRYMADPVIVTDGVRDARELERPPYLGVPGGGAIVARREVLADVPLDPRFIGWGQEDDAIGTALTTLAGRPVRVRRPLIHLWHPPAERIDQRVGSMSGWLLWRRYHRARDNPAAMRAIIAEVDELRG